MDVISAEDRALIDEAIAAGQVQHIPRGHSSFSDDIAWNGRNLVYVDKAKTEALRSTSSLFNRRSGPRKDPKVAARRAKVRDLAQTGKNTAEIAKILGTTPSIVSNDAKVMKVTIQRKPPKQRVISSRYNDEVQERRRIIKEAYDGKRTTAQIEAITGIPRRSVRDHLKALGLKIIHGRAGVAKDDPRRVAIQKRRCKVKEMVAQGMTGPEKGRRDRRRYQGQHHL